MPAQLNEIETVANQLKEVQKALDVFKQKQLKRESVDEAALTFVEKASLVLDRAEKGVIHLTEDQKRRIRNNLLKIRNSLVTYQK
ncbi:hypothetical protein CH373_02590 [Leptospira perolatii]|uniref:Uncharacterized protein n=1 Tax=Leptospira perolatii TaxID=2023191 RepID=A0A2M9ZSI8_9LEPT|nr:hypothetical protein [Leptospira perolatii]PJZ71405.1 hypothetical protein CH360_02590 [Leptospira perolatii]PJZ74939.1 hypothetical protein CH373_02590 [Leptospira perolatii]